MRFRLSAIIALALLAVPAQASYTPTLNSAIFAGSTSGTVTLQATATAGTNTVTLPAQTGTVALIFSGATSSLGGSALTAGTCSTTTATITGAASGMSVIATPTTYPGAGFYWQTYVSASNTVTVAVCAAVNGTPTASIYNIRAFQ